MKRLLEHSKIRDGRDDMLEARLTWGLTIGPLGNLTMEGTRGNARMREGKEWEGEGCEGDKEIAVRIALFFSFS